MQLFGFVWLQSGRGKAGHTGGRRGEGGGEGASACETDRESSGEGKKKS